MDEGPALDTSTASGSLAALGALAVDDATLRRLIKARLGLRGAGLRVPHHHCFVVPKDVVATLRDASALPDPVLVIAADAAATPLGLWRLLFHARVHLELDAKPELTIEVCRERIDAIGQAEFDEIRGVLHQEHLLIPPGDERAQYCELVALYLELRCFQPDAIEHTFPAMRDLARIDAVVARDLDAVTVLAATRPPAAPESPSPSVVVPIEPSVSAAFRAANQPTLAPARKAATRARARGNLARAAIWSARAGDLSGARGHIELLVDRLAAALGLDGSPVLATWVPPLLAVAESAATQESTRFNIDARLLADLQAACTYAEREVKTVDLVTWALSLGRRPIVRPLPSTREVRVAKRLRKASARVPACALPDADDREQLAEVMHAISERADLHVRASLRPLVESALAKVGLEPHSLPERVALKKLVDELLDRAVDLGRLTLGDLRDAISKNDLKLPDLTVESAREGDQLLRTDRILAISLDGVYRSGEIYLRALQKASSVMFGTSPGRFLTRYALLPLLGAFALIEGLQHMIGPLMGLITGHHPVIATPLTRYGTAAFLFLVLHVPLFRRGVLFVLRWLWRGIRLLLFDLPRALWGLPIVRRIVDSRVYRWVVRPAIPALVFALCAGGFGRNRWPIAGGVFVVLALLMSSRIGRRVEEMIADWVIMSSRKLTTHFLPGLLRWTLQQFAKLADLADRGMYRVDELLRFRTGQGPIQLVLKGALSTLWFFVAYVLRLYVDLFIEPTTNPIKHFPVVTVAAKILIPFIPAISSGVAGPASSLLGPAFGNSFAAFTVIVLPGLAGFLVWELKENWKLYRATRAQTLGPLAIGSHGETLVGLLKPGFHSGTLPKLFTKLRRAAWRHDLGAIARQQEAIHHVEVALENFCDRQLVSMLVEVESFRARDVMLAGIRAGSNRIELTMACARLGEPCMLRFELQSGWIVAGIAQAGWIDALDAEQRRIFEIALAGFYKLAGVAILREQLEHALRDGTESPRYDIADEGLVVWPDGAFGAELVYDLRATKLVPTARGAAYHGPRIDLGGRHALFGREPLYWSVWSTTWQQIQRSEVPMPIIVGPSLLPDPV